MLLVLMDLVPQLHMVVLELVAAAPMVVQVPLASFILVETESQLLTIVA